MLIRNQSKKPDRVKIYEEHGAGKVGDKVGDTIGQAAMRFRIPLELGDGADARQDGLW